MLMRSVTQLCLTLCDSMDHSPVGFSIHRISQARILETVAISFFRRSSQPRDQTHISCIGRQIFFFNHWATWEAQSERVSCSVMSSRTWTIASWTIAYQAPLSMEFSRQEYWSRWPFPSPGNLDPGLEPGSPGLQADSLPSETPLVFLLWHSLNMVRWLKRCFHHFSSFFSFCTIKHISLTGEKSPCKFKYSTLGYNHLRSSYQI